MLCKRTTDEELEIGVSMTEHENSSETLPGFLHLQATTSPIFVGTTLNGKDNSALYLSRVTTSTVDDAVRLTESKKKIMLKCDRLKK